MSGREMVPFPTRKRPDLCSDHGHPGVTFNPWMGKTWCLCGEVVRDGDCATHAACCGGPLETATVRCSADARDTEFPERQRGVA